MLSYKAWANKRLFETLEPLPDSVLLAPQKIKFGSIIATAQHVYEMDIVWQAHLQSTGHNIDSRVPRRLLSIEELYTRQQEIDAWFKDFSSQTLEPDKLIEFAFIDGGEGKMTAFDMLLHVVNHATYHRGHIAQMLYSSDVVPPVTDFPVFLREHTDGN